ncbi:hypothetical protein N7466_002865 [Penicillium verhagenii]|uniref:uncharacterized protein n=1 Tax=Penicillium verhagenii TaxID=1562060 RepID=UPI002545038E|nr:uncharacterized protein N7466_002865 [Penicillium verhagenii]KAJ5939731.1 hypothetical protein N7466_002865 [Penicillium verhagenii]
MSTTEPSTKPLATTDHPCPVQAIKVTVHTTGFFFEGDTRSGNHASIYLLIPNGDSVQLNM